MNRTISALLGANGTDATAALDKMQCVVVYSEHISLYCVSDFTGILYLNRVQ